MALVYWIRKPCHTDIFSEGYVGVTTKSSEERFKEHISRSNSNSRKKSVVHKAIKAIGHVNLVFETILIAEEMYCYNIENKLRPQESVGWNVAIGGSKPPGVKGLPVSEETRAKLSEALKGRKKSATEIENHRQSLKGYKHSDETRAKVSAALTGRPSSLKSIELLIERNIARTGEKRTTEQKAARSKFLKEKGYWNTKKANKDIWKQAEWLFEMFHQGWTRYKLARAYEGFGTVGDCLESIWRHFTNGWNPSEDTLWLNDFKNKEAEYAPQSA